MKKFVKLLLLGTGICYLSFTGLLNTDIPSVLAADTGQKSDKKKAPDFKLKNLEGKDIQLSDFKGQIVLVNFWATWCGPCRMEIPDFVELQKKYKKQGFTIIGISVDDGGIEDVKPFYEQYKMNYPVVLSDNKIDTKFGGVFGLPTSFLIDREGQIIERIIGYRSKADWEKMIVKLLETKKS